MTETTEKPAALFKQAKDYSPIEYWDQIAYQLIRQELAPKGYSEIKRGPWRGTIQSNIPFLPKKTVGNCQKISAQLVRSFREKSKAKVNQILAELDKWSTEDYEKLKACRWWQFSKKTELKYKIRSLMGQAGSAQRILNELDQIGIK